MPPKKLCKDCEYFIYRGEVEYIGWCKWLDVETPEDGQACEDFNGEAPKEK